MDLLGQGHWQSAFILLKLTSDASSVVLGPVHSGFNSSRCRVGDFDEFHSSSPKGWFAGVLPRPGVLPEDWGNSRGGGGQVA